MDDVKPLGSESPPSAAAEGGAADGGVDDDRAGEACGVFGVYAPGQSVAHLTYRGLYAVQHRGQEAAGMAVSDGDSITVVKDMGLVTNVFNERNLAPLTGHLAIGHTRYSTTGASVWKNAQPIYRGVGDAEFALGHNGNLTNTVELAEGLGVLPGTLQSDSEVVAELIQEAIVAAGPGARSDGRDLERALMTVLPSLKGAFSFVLMDEAHVVGVRDPNGFRPLCLGRLDSGWVLASETPALDIVGAHFVRELEPGEMVVIDTTGTRSIHPFPPERINPKLCLFEFVYFARPDSLLYGQTVHSARQRMGELLADQSPLPPPSSPRSGAQEPSLRSGTQPDAEAMVMPVPESGIPAAEGYARRSGIPFGHGLVKNRYIGRTFIVPSQDQRSQGVRMKLNPIRDNIAGKRLVVVDDSIVRGTTTRAMVAMLREAGAAEIHLRISSPPYRWPCFYGMDTGTRSQLLAADLTVPQVREYLACDTLAYLDLDRLLTATGAASSGFCAACITGSYPVAIPGMEAPGPAVPEILPIAEQLAVDPVHPCG
ncbi:MAG TPA: amidophosphoribosyltransferase [Acidimicrobiales bacterium]|nr:amidophosphoribosyltransferase [Acidimicrobiales bacterium]